MNACTDGDPCRRCTAARKVMPFPSSVVCVLTERCNQRCGICGYSERSPPRDLSPDLFRRLVREAKASGHSPTLVLTGGEPTLHPELPVILRELSEWPGPVKLLTNGTPVGSDVAQRFFSSSHPHQVVVTLYGRPRIHDSITGVTGSFERVEQGVALWRRAAEEAARPQTHTVGLAITLCSVNACEVPFVLERAKAWGASFVTVEPVYRPRVSAWELSRSIRLGALEQNAAWTNTAATLGLHLEDFTPFLLLQPRCCVVPMRSVYIGAAGSVFACILSKGGFRDDDARALGSILTAGLATVWHSPAFSAFRMKAGAREHAFCSECLPRHHALTLSEGPCLDCNAVAEITVTPEPPAP